VTPAAFPDDRRSPAGTDANPVDAAIETRQSMRQFLPTPVPR